MNIFDDSSIYLPKYLSEESSKELKEELGKFSTDGTKGTIYTSKLCNESILFQGDGFKDFKIVDLINNDFKESPVVLFSNTCDMDINNKRKFGVQVCYAPVINLDKYLRMISSSLENEENKNNQEQQSANEIQNKISKLINNHVDDIKKQRITQILFLPKGGGLESDSIVFLDRIFNIDRKYINEEKIRSDRLFTLSDYGLYLFLLKIAIHFTRIKENVDRFKGVIHNSRPTSET